MNLTTSISNTTSNTWKRIKAEYIALACGLALAAVAAAGLSDALPSRTGTSVAPESAPAVSAARPADRPHTFLIVDDEGWAHFINSSIAADAAYFDTVKQSDYSTIVVKDAEQQWQLVQSMMEQVSFGSNALFVDLRQGPPPALPVAATFSGSMQDALAIESAQGIAAGEAWHFGSVSHTSPATGIVVETPESIAGGEAWQHGAR